MLVGEFLHLPLDPAQADMEHAVSLPQAHGWGLRMRFCHMLSSSLLVLLITNRQVVLSKLSAQSTIVPLKSFIFFILYRPIV